MDILNVEYDDNSNSSDLQQLKMFIEYYFCKET